MILNHSPHRRRLLVGASGGLAAALLPSFAFSASTSNARPPEAVDPDRFLEALPGKRPLIRQTQRPFNYETPLSYFDDTITQNDAFFVRYHLSEVPTRINPDGWRLEVGGEGVSSSQSFSLLDLKNQFEQVAIGGGMSVLRQSPWIFEPARPRCAVGLWRHGKRGVARCSVEGRSQ